MNMVKTNLECKKKKEKKEKREKDSKGVGLEPDPSFFFTKGSNNMSFVL